jgi:hypothetical protein
VECAKLREDEILQDKTKQHNSAQQTGCRLAFRDKQVQIRRANASLNENFEMLSMELDQVIELDESFDNSVCQNMGDHTNEHGDDPCAGNIAEVTSLTATETPSRFTGSLDESKCSSLEPRIEDDSHDSGHPETCLFDVSQVEPLATENAMSADTANPSDVSEVVKSADDNVPQICDGNATHTDNRNAGCDVTKFSDNEDTPDTGDYVVAGVITSAGIVTDTVASDEQLETHDVPMTEVVTVPKTEITDSRTVANSAKKIETLGEVAVSWQSPTDESSDAYTDVLDEDTDHMSEVLDKEDQPEPAVYTELQNELSALVDSPCASHKLLRCDAGKFEIKKKHGLNAAEENELGWLTQSHSHTCMHELLYHIVNSNYIST